MEHSIARRPFIKTALGAGLATSFLKVHGEETEKKSKKLGWAIVGLGALSSRCIAPALKKTKHSYLAGVVTGTPAKAEEWKKKYGLKDGGIYTYDNFDEMVNNPDIDVVYIVLPNSLHKEFALRAAKAGKHVYVEKPMAMNPEECREMITACEKAKVKLGVAYRLQFEPHHMEMIRFGKEKVFGEITHIDSGFGFKMGKGDGWRLKKSLGGGALLDVGVYAIQGVRYVLGEEPVTVSAIETKTDHKKFAEVDETVTWMMQFASGKTANLLCSFNMKNYNQLTAFAEKGKFGMTPCFGISNQKGWTSNPEIPLDFPGTDHFEVQMDVFSQDIMEGRESKVQGLEGLKDHLVMEAVFKSIASGKLEKVGKV